MLSIEVIRQEPDLVCAALARRGEDAPIDQVLQLDSQRRATISEADELRARANETSRLLSSSRERTPQLVDEMRQVRSRVRDLERSIREIEEQLDALLLAIPNLPSEHSPDGAGEEDNVIVRQLGETPAFEFEPLAHWDLGEKLGIIDFERGAKLSGSRFYVLKGKGAKLQRALVSWMLDLHTGENEYEEVYLPALVLEKTATVSGQLPKFADTMYHDDEDDLWLIPTAEVPLTGMHRDEILPAEALPINYAAHTPCFRRERAAAGRDTRGIKRVHQFEKVELYKIVEPEQSEAELERLVSNAEEVCRRLGLAYRVIELCTGDLGALSARTFDIEAWAAGSQEWLEVSSCSNCTDYQARRARIRYRPAEGGRPRYVHTLNGSGTALPRIIISILESFQQADGSVVIPEVLWPYTGFDRIEAPVG
jgi:seryl-tRNA synthetase